MGGAENTGTLVRMTLPDARRTPTEVAVGSQSNRSVSRGGGIGVGGGRVGGESGGGGGGRGGGGDRGKDRGRGRGRYVEARGREVETEESMAYRGEERKLTKEDIVE